MENNGVIFLISVITIFAVYIPLGRRQARNPRPRINKERRIRYEEATPEEGCG